MKKLEPFGIQEMNYTEIKNTSGGSTVGEDFICPELQELLDLLESLKNFRAIP